MEWKGRESLERNRQKRWTNSSFCFLSHETMEQRNQLTSIYATRSSSSPAVSLNAIGTYSFCGMGGINMKMNEKAKSFTKENRHNGFCFILVDEEWWRAHKLPQDVAPCSLSDFENFFLFASISLPFLGSCSCVAGCLAQSSWSLALLHTFPWSLLVHHEQRLLLMIAPLYDGSTTVWSTPQSRGPSGKNCTLWGSSLLCSYPAHVRLVMNIFEIEQVVSRQPCSSLFSSHRMHVSREFSLEVLFVLLMGASGTSCAIPCLWNSSIKALGISGLRTLNELFVSFDEFFFIDTFSQMQVLLRMELLDHYLKQQQTRSDSFTQEIDQAATTRKEEPRTSPRKDERRRAGELREKENEEAMVSTLKKDATLLLQYEAESLNMRLLQSLDFIDISIHF